MDFLEHLFQVLICLVVKKNHKFRVFVVVVVVAVVVLQKPEFSNKNTLGTEIFCMFKRLSSRQEIPLQKLNVLNVVNDIMLPFEIFFIYKFYIGFYKTKN